MDKQKVVLNFLDRRILKGHMEDFSPQDNRIVLSDQSSRKQTVALNELKAVFFVRTFGGDKGHKESKSFTGTSSGKRVLVRFRDGETIVGHLEGNVPWQKGFFLETKKGGFYLRPVDKKSNNHKVFVVSASVEDVTCF
ncbi:MAG: DUF6982 domain-containing protein [Nitrospirota bacterium]